MQPVRRPATYEDLFALPKDVRAEIVGGEIVVEDGHSTRVDEQRVIAEAQAAAEGLVVRCGLDKLRAPWRR